MAWVCYRKKEKVFYLLLIILNMNFTSLIFQSYGQNIARERLGGNKNE